MQGYATPADQVVNVTAGNTTVVTGTFVPQALLRVLTSPAVPGTITIDGIRRNDWGVWTYFPPGAHQVCFVAVLDVPAADVPERQPGRRHRERRRDGRVHGERWRAG